MTKGIKGFQKGHPCYVKNFKYNLDSLKKYGFQKGNVGWNKGLTKETDERIRKYSEKLIGKKPSDKSIECLKQYNKTHTPWNKGKKCWEGRKHPKGMLGKTPWNKGLTIEDPRVLKYSSKKVGMKRPDVIIRNKNPEFIKKSLSALFKRPTSFEEKVGSIFIKNKMPFVYTGNGTFLIGGKNPDFINKENKIAIEVYYPYFKIRDYGSIENYEKLRKEYFSQYGWKTIFLCISNSRELSNFNFEDFVLNKIRKEVESNAKEVYPLCQEN